MNEEDEWILFDGPEPAIVAELLDAVRELPPATPDDKARVMRAFFEKLDAMLAGEHAPGSALESESSGPPEAVLTPVEDPPKRRASLLEAPAEPPAPSGLAVGSRDAPPTLGQVPVIKELEGPPSGTTTRAEPPPPSTAGRRPLPVGAETFDLSLDPEARRKILEGAKVPFVPPDKVPAEKKAPRTSKVPVYRSGLGSTAGVADDAMTQAVAALPFVGQTVGQGVVSVPRLTLLQYASLCVELSRALEPEEVIRDRYRVLNRAALDALNAKWHAELVAQPEMRAAFDDARARYLAWHQSVYGT